jgi:nucleoside phosphorylase
VDGQPSHPCAVLVGIAGVRRYWRYRKAIIQPVRDLVDAAARRTRVVLLVATEVERKAVLDAAGVEHPVVEYHDHPVTRLGVIGGAEVLLAQTDQGSIGPISSTAGVLKLLAEQEPRYLVAVGICFGLQPDRQAIGDIIVSRQLQLVDHRKVVGDPPEVFIRGDLVTASPRLYHRFTVTERPPGVAVHLGTMVTTNTLVNSRQLRDEYVRLSPEAAGGEMEGAGMYTVAGPAGVDWIVVKAISDLGFDKTDAHQALAARNAACFVLELIRRGGLAN